MRSAIEFLDSRTVEHTHFLDRRVTPIRRYEHNPIIPEANDIATVLKGNDGVIRLWYKTKVPVPGIRPHGGRIVIGVYRLCYAESTDGITWTRPELGLKDVDGSKANNVVLNYAGTMGPVPPEYKKPDVDSAGRPVEANCILDRELTPMPHTRGRFTALSHHGTSFAFSDDGLTWTAYPENPVVSFGGSDTYNSFVFDPDTGRYVLFHRPHPNIHAGWARVNRLVARIESDDLVNWDWDSARCVLDTDSRDAPAVNPKGDSQRGRLQQFYGVNVVRHGDLFVGLAQLLDDGRNGWFDVHLVHSRDGIDWQRELPDQPLIPLLGHGHWDSGMVWAKPPIPMGDDLYIYYTGSNMSHQYQMMNDETLDQRQIGLGIIRRGRLVGYHAGEAEGELLTRPFMLTAGQLFLNADASGGEIKAAVAQGNGKPVPGLGKEDFTPISGDGLELPMVWGEPGKLAELVGQRIRLRIAVRTGAIYGLQMGQR
ncbi:MAG: hypothetical protein HN742_25025 [Lentisphaerae bacterium]|jgi:hypothetical protein|nr:hypothetical protein [Lentisphaerota bacterium]MBT5607543.1 hypothetical protein [Lentisphaerota bacterium]MBT7054596.1 hypothetical protein [Lentisphaerota bacterium]MBT7845165.1 hypothetical protein [Lentisphaerota bacterium]